MNNTVKSTLCISDKPLIIISHCPGERVHGVCASVHHAFLKTEAPHKNVESILLQESTAKFADHLKRSIQSDSIIIINGAVASVHPNAMNAVEYCRCIGVPVVYFWHESMWMLKTLEKNWPKRVKRLRKIVASSELVHWTVGSAGKQALFTFFDIDRDSIAVVGNAFEPSVEANSNIRGNTKGRTIRFVGAGKTSESMLYCKGVDYFCRLASKLKSIDGRPCEFLWFGGTVDSVYSAGIEVPDNCKFMGFRADWQAWLKDTDAFLLTSFDEAFGIVGIEAMSYDLPTFCIRGTGATDYVPEAFQATHWGELPEKILEYWRNRNAYPNNFFRNRVDPYIVDTWYANIATRQFEARQYIEQKSPYLTLRETLSEKYILTKNRIRWKIAIND